MFLLQSLSRNYEAISSYLEFGSFMQQKNKFYDILISSISLNKSTVCVISGTLGSNRSRLNRFRLNSCVVRTYSAIARVKKKKTLLELD